MFAYFQQACIGVNDYASKVAIQSTAVDQRGLRFATTRQVKIRDIETNLKNADSSHLKHTLMGRAESHNFKRYKNTF